MTRSGCVLAPKYTPKVVPTTILIPTPQEGVFVYVPTTLVEAPESSMTKVSSGNSAEAITLRGKEVITEKEKAKKIITA